MCSFRYFAPFDITHLIFFEFLLLQQKKKRKILAKFDFKIFRWIYHKAAPLSNSVPHSANTENQIYSTLSICSIITYPSVVTMTKSLCYHHRMTIFQST